MKKLLSALLFLIYFLTSIVYINLYEFKGVRNMLWENNDVSSFSVFDVKKIKKPSELIEKLEFVAKKNNVNIYNIKYQGKSANGKRKIKVYTTCNKGAFDNVHLINGRVLTNGDLENKFISSENTGNENQVGKVKFFSLNSTLNIYNLSGVLYNGESIGCWFVNTNDSDKIELLNKDLQNTLNCEKLTFYSDHIDNTQSMEAFSLRYNMVEILIVLYVITFLTMIYWLFSRYKELAVRKMFGMSNMGIKIKMILKELLKIHIIGLSVSGLMIFGFLIFKLGFSNVGLFFKDWLIFNLILTLISLILMFIPMSLIKYIKIPLMLKNKKPTKLTQRINYATKCLVGVAAITVIINSSNSLIELINKKAENEVWNKALNYGLVKASVTFAGTIKNQDDHGDEFLHANMKKWFKVCNKKGAIYINASEYIAGSKKYEAQMAMLYGEKIDEVKETISNNICVNNNYLQINPIYDVDGKQVNIPDHDEHTLNVLVPQNLKKYENKIKEEYSDEFHSNGWEDYKLNIIYIKDNQKCFTFRKDLALETKNYVIGSIIRVISNNNMYLDCYACCECMGFYPKIKNIDNPYQDLLPDIKACGVEKLLVGATTLYEKAAQDIYKTQQQFIHTIELLVFSISLLLMLIISTCVNYLEQNKIKNMILKLHGVGFVKRSLGLLKPILLTWWLSIFLMVMLNYNGEILENILCSFYLPYKMILITMPAPWIRFDISYINWYTVIGVILADIIISLTFLKIYENKKIGSVLKGD